MNKRVSKRKFLLVLVLLIPILVYIYIHEVRTGGPEGASNIFEIKNIQMVYYSPNSKIATIEKHYMIVKPPENLSELKTLVEKFNEENPINLEFAVDEIRKAKNISAEDIKKKDVYIFFYRESKRLPRKWQPDETYMNTDRIEHHKDDCIAVIRWSDLEMQKSYDIMKKSSNKSDYGSIIEEIH